MSLVDPLHFKNSISRWALGVRLWVLVTSNVERFCIRWWGYPKISRMTIGHVARLSDRARRVGLPAPRAKRRHIPFAEFLGAVALHSSHAKSFGLDSCVRVWTEYSLCTTYIVLNMSEYGDLQNADNSMVCYSKKFKDPQLIVFQEKFNKCELNPENKKWKYDPMEPHSTKRKMCQSATRKKIVAQNMLV